MRGRRRLGRERLDGARSPAAPSRSCTLIAGARRHPRRFTFSRLSECTYGSALCGRSHHHIHCRAGRGAPPASAAPGSELSPSAGQAAKIFAPARGCHAAALARSECVTDPEASRRRRLFSRNPEGMRGQRTTTDAITTSETENEVTGATSWCVPFARPLHIESHPRALAARASLRDCG